MTTSTPKKIMTPALRDLERIRKANEKWLSKDNNNQTKRRSDNFSKTFMVDCTIKPKKKIP